MDNALPELKIYYIDIKDVCDRKNNNVEGGNSGRIAALKDTIKSFGKTIVDSRHIPITTRKELARFVNARGNKWYLCDARGKRQYYILHPKNNASNCLIEAGDFHKFIDDEERDELLDFIFSHCPVKYILIDRKEVTMLSGEAKKVTFGANVKVFGKDSLFFEWNSSRGAVHRRTRKEYVWLSKSLMNSISALRKGGELKVSFTSDHTFGMNIGDARAIGIDAKGHKNYVYTLIIRC